MIVPHDDPYTPFDRHPAGPGGSGPAEEIPDEFLPRPGGDGRLRVGVRMLDPAQWVSRIDARWAPTVAMKRNLVAERRGEVVAARENSGEACEEVARGIAGSLGLPPPRATGTDALVEAALCVADDLCVLLPDRAGTPVLAAAVVCSPNRWVLAEKMGRAMPAIHAPVARYDSDVSSPVDAMLGRLAAERPYWRVNWGVVNHAALFQPVIPPETPGMAPGEMWLRVEWQTLRRLGESGGVLFTIRTHLERVSGLAGRNPRAAADLGEVLAATPREVAAYKGIAPYRTALCAYLSGA